MYHGSNDSELERFIDDYKSNDSKTVAILGNGIYTSDDMLDCHQYGSTVYACRVAYSHSFLQYDEQLTDTDHLALCDAIKSLDDRSALEEYENYSITWDIMQWYRYILNYQDHSITATMIANTIDVYGVQDDSRSRHSGIVYCSWFPSYVKILHTVDPDN